jgi:2-methylcitrate dehydratase PrpD
MTLARQLATRVVGTVYEHLTPAVHGYARIGLLDTIAVGIAGASDAAAVIARRVLQSRPGPALAWGTSERVASLDAAFANGVAANVLDFDDCTDNLGGHPSSPILPALLALAEELGAGGRDVLTAYVAGFEIETCLARGVNFHHYEKGWHPTATLGVFGAAAACARLMGLGVEQTTHALALCASLSSGVKANLGSMAKPMHVGHCSRNGLLAARLAAEGFTGNDDALERHQGFLEVFNGPGCYDVSRILEKWGTPWEIEMPGIAVKQYPCCLSTQAVVDAILELVRRHDIDARGVARVQARLSSRRLEHTDRPEPRSALDAKLSVQYVLARALKDRAVDLRHFEEGSERDPEVRRIMSLVEVQPLDAETLRREGDFHAHVTVTLHNGRSVFAARGRPVGHEAGVPLPPALHKAKFEACLRQRLGPARMESLYQAVQSFGEIADMRELTQWMIPCGLTPP